MESIEYTVRRIIQGQLECNNEDILNSSSFEGNLQVDSIRMVELILAFEQTFGIEIPFEDIDKLKTVQSVIDYINNKTNK